MLALKVPAKLRFFFQNRKVFFKTDAHPPETGWFWIDRVTG